MIVLPGPAFIVIPAGLGILAVEFVWARRWLDGLKRAVRRLEETARRRGWPTPRSRTSKATTDSASVPDRPAS